LVAAAEQAPAPKATTAKAPHHDTGAQG
jgi:hypothetical protein